jgi:hypothetical protein
MKKDTLLAHLPPGTFYKNGMKKLICLALFAISLQGKGQNVGIGTNFPAGKLQLNHRSTLSNPSLVIFDSSTSNAGRIKFMNAGGNRYWQFSSIINNNNPGNHFMDFRTDSLIILTLRGNGDVGINNLVPAYKLDVGGDGYFDGILRVNDKLGLGTTTPTEKLDVNGNINLNGLIKINGSGGTAGQVLTSNGAGDPQWKNAAYSNNSRFAADIPLTSDNNPLSYNTIYNLNPADVTISGTTITINKSGLWHFEGYVHQRIRWDSPPAAQAFHASLNVDGIGHTVMDLSPMDRNFLVAGDAEYVKTARFSNEIYVSAPATVFVSRAISLTAGGSVIVSRTAYGNIFGFLISE